MFFSRFESISQQQFNAINVYIVSLSNTIQQIAHIHAGTVMTEEGGSV